MDKSEIKTWKFIRKDDFGNDVTYRYMKKGKNLILSVTNADGTGSSDTLGMYNMESEVGLEMAFKAAKSTCEEGNGNDHTVLVCKQDSIEYGVLVDERDGNEYRIAKYGNQWWMIQFLKYED
jgi:hypothetical protein